MKKPKRNVFVLVLVFSLCLLLSACTAATTPEPVFHTSETPESTLTPEPIMTATSTPDPSPFDYMLSTEELPVELYKSFSMAYLEKDGSVTYMTSFFDASYGSIRNYVTISQDPYLEAPVLMKGSPVTDETIPANARASLDSSGTTTNLNYEFFKGNTLVQITGTLTLEQAVSLQKIVEARLPESLPVDPITFPDQLDQAAFNEHLNSLILLEETRYEGDPVIANLFDRQDSLCIKIDPIVEGDKYAFAVYDVANAQIVMKVIPEYSLSCYPFFGVFQPGQYEVWFAVNGTLVSKIPIEIK